MSETPRRKNIIPASWTLYTFLFVLISLPVYIFVINLSFQKVFWEESLKLTGITRWVALYAMVLFCWAIYLLIGIFRKMVQILREE